MHADHRIEPLGSDQLSRTIDDELRVAAGVDCEQLDFPIEDATGLVSLSCGEDRTALAGRAPDRVSSAKWDQQSDANTVCWSSTEQG